MFELASCLKCSLPADQAADSDCIARSYAHRAMRNYNFYKIAFYSLLATIVIAMLPLLNPNNRQILARKFGSYPSYVFEHPERHFYSQHAEDIVVRTIFAFLQRPLRTYLDIGAWDPVIDNNTYLFYTAGARGVLIEPNPHYVEKIRGKRPGDTVLAVGVGFDGSKSADYYMIGDGKTGLNTFSEEQAKSHGDYTKVEMPLITMGEVLDSHFGKQNRNLDFLSIDVEGLDLIILKTMDFDKYRPIVICVETLKVNSRQTIPEIERFLESKGYVVRGATFVNTIFVDSKLLNDG